MAPGEGRLTTSISRASTVQSAELAGMEVTAWVSVLHGQGSMLGTGSGGTERESCCAFPAIPVQWLLQRSQAEEGKQLGSKHIYSGKKLLSQCSSAMDWPRPQVMGDYNRTKLPVCFGLFWNFTVTLEICSLHFSGILQHNQFLRGLQQNINFYKGNSYIKELLLCCPSIPELQNQPQGIPSAPSFLHTAQCTARQLWKTVSCKC